MKRFKIFVKLLILFLFCFFEVKATIHMSGEEKIIFTSAKIQKEVSWSKWFSLTENGLETEQLPVGQSRNVWILTHPFPIGLSWRPPTSSNFYVSLDGEFAEPQIYIRYSCDKINWSTWYSFNKIDRKTEERFGQFKSEISIPYSLDKYKTLMREWWKTKPVWSSDENEFCEWVIKKEPDFFEKEFPFIGYVQVLIDYNFTRFAKIESLKIGYTWVVSGLQSFPQDQSKVRKNTDEKWFFVGVKK